MEPRNRIQLSTNYAEYNLSKNIAIVNIIIVTDVAIIYKINVIFSTNMNLIIM